MKETSWLNRIHYSDGDMTVSILTRYMGNLYRKIISPAINIAISKHDLHIICVRCRINKKG